jgi:RHS repeat-associated protein
MGDASTGLCCFALPPDPSAALQRTFAIETGNVGGTFLVSCWIKVASDVGGQAGVRVVESGEVFPFDATDGEWRYFSAALVATETVTLQLFNHTSATTVQVDDLFFAPLVGGAAAQVYDPKRWRVSASVDFAGRVERRLEDPLQRSAGAIGPTGAVEYLEATALARAAPAGERDASAMTPNARLSVFEREGGAYQGFLNGDRWKDEWQSDSPSSWGVTADADGGALCHLASIASAESIALGRTASWTNYGFRVVVSLGSSKEVGLRIGDFSVVWTPAGFSVCGGAPDGSPFAQTWIVSLYGRSVLVFADGRLVHSSSAQQDFTGALTFVADGTSSIRDLCLLQQPTFAIAYLDGFGREVQSQHMNGGDLVVNGHWYDDLARPILAAKAMPYRGRPPGYVESYLTGFDDSTGKLAGDVADYYAGSGGGSSDDAGFPYAGFSYEASPLARPQKAGMPGASFAIQPGDAADEHVVTVRYGLNADGWLPSGDLPASRYYALQQTDADGRSSFSLVDAQQRPLVQATGPLEDGTYLIQHSRYDAAGRPVEVRLPNYFRPPAGSSPSDWVIERTYGYDGTVVQESTPDTGTARFVYDPFGRLRFAIDAAGASVAPNLVRYHKYDRLGRETESGCLRIAWDEQALQAHADGDPAFPQSDAVWLAQYVYDGDGGDPNAIGRVVRATTRTDAGSPAVDETYAYDPFGRVASSTLVADAFDAVPRTTSYEYDNVGNVTLVRLPEGSPAPAVSYGYDDVGQLVEVGTPGDPDAFGSFSIDVEGGVEGARIASGLTLARSYASPGWAESVTADGPSGAAFSKDTSYTADGYHGAGYFSGKIARESYTYGPSVGYGSYDYRYAYDRVGRLTAAEHSTDTSKSWGTASPPTFDADGNCLGVSRGGVDMAFSLAPGTNRLEGAKASDGSFVDALAYDGRGFVESSSAHALADVAYHPETQRVVSAALGSDGRTLECHYDALGRRVVRQLLDAKGALLSSRLYVASAVTGATLELAQGESPVQIIPLAGGASLMLAGDQVWTRLNDHLGSTRVVVGSDGAIVAAFDYLPFGDAMHAPAGSAPDAVRYRYIGRELDPDTGLYDFRARWYDPTLGRFYGPDAMRQFPSPYVYAGGDPILYLDPSGHFSIGGFFAHIGALLLGALEVFLGGLLVAASGGLAAIPVAVWLTVVAGGAVVGMGMGSMLYGVQSTDFDAKDWGINMGSGALFGAAASAFEPIAGLATGRWALAIAGGIDSALGGIDGFVTNGWLNEAHGESFTAGSGKSVGLGLLLGGVGGLFGRSFGGMDSALQNAERIRAGQGSSASVNLWDAQSGFHVGTAFETRGIWDGYHFRKEGGERVQELPRFDPEHTGTRTWGIPMGEEDVRIGRTRSRELVVEGMQGCTNTNCVAFSRLSLRASGLQAPGWAFSPMLMTWWFRLMGGARVARRAAAVPLEEL